MTFRDLGDERFAHGYQGKNLMRQIAGSFSTAIAAIALQDRQFVNYSQIAGTLSSRQRASDGLDRRACRPGSRPRACRLRAAHGAALAELARVVEQQSLLMSCEDMYRALAVMALGTAAIVLLQRRLK